MSTLIPKTSVVRLAFVTAMVANGLTEEQAEAQFDTWLEETTDEARSSGFDAGLQSAEMCS